MGAVFGPKDLGRNNQKIVENAVKDFSPGTKDTIISLLDSWEGKMSGRKMKGILGQDKAEELLKNIIEKEEDVNLSGAERIKFRNMFEESLTFD
jgi:hypothetical protein